MPLVLGVLGGFHEQSADRINAQRNPTGPTVRATRGELVLQPVSETQLGINPARFVALAIMPNADPFPKVKRAILRVLKEGVGRHGFIQFQKTVYSIRDRERLRDAFFFQKMRSNAICIAYGMSTVPEDGEWNPGLLPEVYRWLNGHEFYRCKYVDQVERSIGRAVADIETEALPWYQQFQSLEDLC